jgi:dienelactone hydrolase
MLKSQKIDYNDGDIQLEGYCAYTDDNAAKKPIILVCHDWSGKNEFACKTADRLAELGYVGFALDMYGQGKVGQTVEEKKALMMPLIQDRSKLQKRIQAALNTVKKLNVGDTQRIGAIGFCFGGLCVLDLARIGADLQCVVTFHGALKAPDNTINASIKPKILVLHGYDDPGVTPGEVMAFANEMSAAKVDWQIHMYGHTMHGFTNPQANDPQAGIVYNKQSAERSWNQMKEFFKEIFQSASLMHE